MRLLFVLLVVSCSNSAPADAPLVGQTKAIVDRMCACRDAACAAGVEKQWNEVANDQPARQLSADDVDQLADLTQRYAKCLAEHRQ